MAITGAALQAALGTTSGRDPIVLREYGTVSTFQEWLIDGGCPTYPGRARLVRTTAADNAATQAAAVRTALAA